MQRWGPHLYRGGSLVYALEPLAGFPTAEWGRTYELVGRPFLLPAGEVADVEGNPHKTYSDLLERPVSERHHHAWCHFVEGWTGCARRFQQASLAHTDFKAAQANLEAIANVTRTDHQLFVFFNAALASLESLAYAVFALGTMFLPRHFPIWTPRERRSVSFGSAAAAYAAAFPRSRLASVLKGTAKHPSLRDLSAVRNVFAHRASPLQANFVSDDLQKVFAIWLLGDHIESARDGDEWAERLTDEMLDERKAWLDDTVVEVVEAACEFADGRDFLAVALGGLPYTGGLKLGPRD